MMGSSGFRSVWVMVRSNKPAFFQESEMGDEPDFVLDECGEFRGEAIQNARFLFKAWYPLILKRQ